MKLLLAGATVLALLVPALASAQTAAKPEEILIKDGVYSCKSCTPAIKIKADNSFYPVKGATFDTVAVRLTGNGFVRTDRKAGKDVTVWNTSVSVDGRTATTTFTSGKANGVIIARRAAPAPAGAHPVSGTWKTADSSGAPPPAH